MEMLCDRSTTNDSEVDLIHAKLLRPTSAHPSVAAPTEMNSTGIGATIGK